MSLIEAETSGRLPKRIYAIKYVQEYVGENGKTHTKTMVEMFSHKSTADYYAGQAETMQGWKVKYLYADTEWVEAEWEEVDD